MWTAVFIVISARAEDLSSLWCGGRKKKKKEKPETSLKILLHRPVHKFLTAALGDGQVSCLSEATSIIPYLLVGLRFQLTPEPLVHIANTSRSWMCLNSLADSH